MSTKTTTTTEAALRGELATLCRAYEALGPTEPNDHLAPAWRSLMAQADTAGVGPALRGLWAAWADKGE